MLTWIKTITGAITSEIFLEPIIMILVGYGIRMYGKNKKYRIIIDITIDLVDYIEANYEKWGIKGSQKMDKFLKMFKEEFKKQMGRNPTQNELETARIRAEAQVYRNRIK